jgi:transposase InsO family protein
MRAAGIVGVSRRRSIITTRRDRNARPAPDLVDRNFTADRPNQLWVADITYIPTAAGFLYLAVVLDAFNRPKRLRRGRSSAVGRNRALSSARPSGPRPQMETA